MTDQWGRTELHYAANDGDAGRVTLLLASGADPRLAGDDGWTPLHFAAQACSTEVAALLLAAGVDVDAQDVHGNTALSRAVFNSLGDGSVIRLLRDAGADPFCKNHHGTSPVDLARGIANYDVRQFFDDLPGAGEPR